MKEIKQWVLPVEVSKGKWIRKEIIRVKEGDMIEWWVHDKDWGVTGKILKAVKR